MNPTVDKALGITELALTGLTVYLALRIIVGKDDLALGRMAIAKTAENFAQRQAEFWAHTADYMQRQYDAARAVTV
jgi:hypothetical protein